jgi:flavin reductase ActVB
MRGLASLVAPRLGSAYAGCTGPDSIPRDTGRNFEQSGDGDAKMRRPGVTAGGLVDSVAFKEAMSRLVAPMTVVTCVDGAGRWYGLTASSVVSASLEPPLVVVAIANTASCHQVLVDAETFVVNILGIEHKNIADRFATPGIDRFGDGGFTSWPGDGSPFFRDAHALVRCRRTALVPVGDHDLLVGAAVELRALRNGTPLVWYRRDFHAAQPC